MSNTKILIVAPAWVGDLVMSLTLLNALREIYKDVTIDLLVNENLYDLAQCLPNVSKLIVSETRHGKLSLFYRIKLGLKLRENKYSECYILSNSFKSSIISLDKLNREILEPIVNNLIKKHETNFKGVGQPLRIILTGSKFGPGLYDIVISLGKADVEKRLRKILN